MASSIAGAKPLSLSPRCYGVIGAPDTDLGILQFSVLGGFRSLQKPGYAKLPWLAGCRRGMYRSRRSYHKLGRAQVTQGNFSQEGGTRDSMNERYLESRLRL